MLTKKFWVHLVTMGFVDWSQLSSFGQVPRGKPCLSPVLRHVTVARGRARVSAPEAGNRRGHGLGFHAGPRWGATHCRLSDLVAACEGRSEGAAARELQLW